MTTALSINEIETICPFEWVLVENPEVNKYLKIQGGTILAHGKDRDAVYREAINLRPKRFAMLYTGTLPHNTAIVL